MVIVILQLDRFVDWNGPVMTENLLLVVMIIRYANTHKIASFFLNFLFIIFLVVWCHVLLYIWAAFGMESALSATNFETYRAHCCCKGYCLVTSSEQPSRIRRWNCWSVYSILEHYKWPSIELCWHWKPGLFSYLIFVHTITSNKNQYSNKIEYLIKLFNA